MKDKLRGSFIGLACGDALGAPVEFREAGSFAPVREFRNGGPFSLNAGEWTDDTSMALALADSLTIGYNLIDQAQKYSAWYSSGKYSVNGRCFDIGCTTRTALDNFLRLNKISGLTAPDDSGNGSIMRLAPFAIRFHKLFPDNLEEYFTKSDECSGVTHASGQCLSACRYLSLILAGLYHGLDKETVLSIDWEPRKKLLAYKRFDNNVIEISQGTFKRKEPPAIKGSGWVVASLEAALWAFWKTDNFEEAVCKAVNLGDDSDTTGAVCGQIAGACYGESNIPQRWKEGLAKYPMLSEVVEKLIEVS